MDQRILIPPFPGSNPGAPARYKLLYLHALPKAPLSEPLTASLLYVNVIRMVNQTQWFIPLCRLWC
jgi:hypothetical protein